MPGPKEVLRRELTPQELAYNSLTVEFKGQVKQWYDNLGFSPDEVLLKSQKELLDVFFTHNLSQKETARALRRSPRRIRTELGITLLKLERRKKVGPKDIGTLQLRWCFESGLVEVGVREIDEVFLLNADKIRKACGTPTGLSVLQKALAEKGIIWNPPEVDWDAKY